MSAARPSPVWMKLAIAAVCAAVAGPDAAIGDDAAMPGRTVSRQFEHHGQNRTYLLHLPDGFQPDAPVPLVIAIHGLGMEGQGMEVFTGFSETADQHGFAVVYPDGLNRMWRFWERPELGEQVKREPGYMDDVGCIAAIIDDLVERGYVDSQRVYATGLSNGGYMSNRLACLLPDKIAAIAPVAGTLVAALAETKPDRPIPVLYIHGTNDRIVGYDGVDQFTRLKSSFTADELVKWWAEQNGCAAASVEPLDDSSPDGCTVLRHVYPAAGENGAPVIFYEIRGGGHTWPDGRRQPVLVMGTVCRDFNASEVIWEFFSEHSLPEQTP